MVVNDDDEQEDKEVVMGKKKYRLEEKNGIEMHPQRESMCQSGKTLTLTNAAGIVSGCLSCLHNDHIKHSLVSMQDPQTQQQDWI
ncbi:hypothetical protein Pmani_024714 [Petrolisthes manimaculis]|uniref:Uncharacterized protein n=1 Tax=Petrolisthes manimaculis TaxID=1843537 RepID=A0AAE1P6Y0_9EUCA|nr:hypothetical protein Pmani_024714 [Petrolisthes manimaculis]